IFAARKFVEEQRHLAQKNRYTVGHRLRQSPPLPSRFIRPCRHEVERCTLVWRENLFPAQSADPGGHSIKEKKIVAVHRVEGDQHAAKCTIGVERGRLKIDRGNVNPRVRVRTGTGMGKGGSTHGNSSAARWLPGDSFSVVRYY